MPRILQQWTSWSQSKNWKYYHSIKQWIKCTFFQNIPYHPVSLSLSFLRIPEFWVAQPWKHELWGVRGPKPFRMPSPPFIVTVSHDLWTLTGQASCFQPLMIYSSVDDSQFSFYDTFLSVFGVKDWIKPLIHIYVFRFESVKKRHTMRGDYGPHLSSFQICRLIT